MGSSAILNQQVGAADQGIGISGSTNATVASPGSVALGVQSRLNTGVDIMGSTVTGGLTIGDTNASKNFADTIRSITEQNTSTLASLATSQSRLPDAAKDLPKTADDNPKEDTLKKWLPGVAVSILAGLVVWYLTRRKS